MEVYVPPGWPSHVSPPGSEDFEPTAVTWIINEILPDLRTSPVRRYPVALAAIARHVVAGGAEGARGGYRQARTELGEHIPPHAVDMVLAAYRDEGRRLVAAAEALNLIERALRGRPV